MTGVQYYDMLAGAAIEFPLDLTVGAVVEGTAI